MHETEGIVERIVYQDDRADVGEEHHDDEYQHPGVGPQMSLLKAETKDDVCGHDSQWNPEKEEQEIENPEPCKREEYEEDLNRAVECNDGTNDRNS